MTTGGVLQPYVVLSDCINKLLVRVLERKPRGPFHVERLRQISQADGGNGRVSRGDGDGEGVLTARFISCQQLEVVEQNREQESGLANQEKVSTPVNSSKAPDENYDRQSTVLPILRSAPCCSQQPCPIQDRPSRSQPLQALWPVDRHCADVRRQTSAARSRVAPEQMRPGKRIVGAAVSAPARRHATGGEDQVHTKTCK